ncbi:FkbM family methyltransferase [bacterium]|nr:FkbM family methyltransferase [bacterium]
MAKNTTTSGKSSNMMARLPVISRIKFIKDFFLDRLEVLENKMDALLNNELKNDAQILKGMTSLTEGLTTLVEEIDSINRRIVTSSESDPETRLMAYLYSYLPSRRALDIGANIGDVAEKLLEVGYEVYAFEPFPNTFDKLKQRLGDYHDFHGYPMAIGSIDETRDLFIAKDKTDENLYKDASLFNSLTKHAMPDNIEFADSISLNVRSLESLHKSNEIPSDIGLVKIDTEGFDLEVLHGMGEHRYQVVVAEFWDVNIPFATSDAFNYLGDMVKEMRTKKYYWYLVIYRIWGSDEASFYCNFPQSLDKSWGNVFFFQNYEIFLQALNWCSSVLKMTYIK